jgi:hypothetical protein
VAAIRQQVFLARDAIVLEAQAHHAVFREAADEQVAAPLGERVTRIELRA